MDVRWFFPGFSGFRPSLMNDRLESISEILSFRYTHIQKNKSAQLNIFSWRNKKYFAWIKDDTFYRELYEGLEYHDKVLLL